MKPGIDHIGNCVVFFCHDGEGNYLFNQRSQNSRDEWGRWDVGGGSINVREPILDSLKRELKEEYCVDPLNYEILGYKDTHRKNGNEHLHWIVFDFKVLVDRSLVRNGELEKFDSLKWFKLDNLPENLHSQLPIALNQNKGRL